MLAIMNLRAAGMGLAALAIVSAHGEITTSEVMPDITSATVWSGVTNTVTTTADVSISADLTLQNQTFYRFIGNGQIDGRDGVITIGPNANDVLVTIDHSGFFPGYRNSKLAGLDIGEEWTNSYYDVRLGIKDQAAGSTGRAKLLLIGNPKFGGNSSQAIIGGDFFVSSSVAANPDTGYVDFMEFTDGAYVSISYIHVEGTVPARMLFHKGSYLYRNNGPKKLGYAADGDGVLAPDKGATLILDSADNEYYSYRKQTVENVHLTAQKGGRVIVRGVDFGLHAKASSFKNYDRPWILSKEDNVTWELTGDFHLTGSTYLKVTDDDLLPHGANTGTLVIDESEAKDATVVNTYCCLDLQGTTQYVNGVTTTGEGIYAGVITNTAEAKGHLVLGKDDIDGTLNIHGAVNVGFKKIGAGALNVATASGEELVLEEGRAYFEGENGFDGLIVKAGVSASGDVSVNDEFNAEAGADCRDLRLTLGANAKITGNIELFTLKVGDEDIAPGTYESEEWLDEGASVTVIFREGTAAVEIAWTGAGDTTGIDNPANWQGEVDTGKFNSFNYAARFTAENARSGEATLGGGVFRLRGLEFNAAQDFTLAHDSANGSLELLGPIAIAEVPGAETRAYTVNAPVRLNEDVTVNVHSNTSLHFTGSLSGQGGITLVGDVKIGYTADDVYAFSEEGTLELVNARVSGAIKHEQGGVLILRGDVGVPGVALQDELKIDVARSINNLKKDEGRVVVDLGTLKLDNVRVHKPFTATGAGALDGKGNNWCTALANTTNIFHGPASFRSTTYLGAEEGAVYVFEQTVAVSGAFVPKAAEFRFNGPVTVTDRSRAFQPGKGTKLTFNATGNHAALYFQGAGNEVEFKVDDAFEDTLFLLTNKDDSLKLNGTHQKMKMLIAGTTSNYAAIGNKMVGEVTGGKGACVEITGGAADWENTSTTNCAVKFTEQVALEKSGTGICLMTASEGNVLEHTSTGPISVTGGTLAFAENVTWAGAPSVTVSQSGTLKLSSAGTFSSKASLCIGKAEDDWRLELPAGASVRFAYLYDSEGRRMPSGTYGGESSPATHKTLASHFTGTGILSIARHGTQLILR